MDIQTWASVAAVVATGIALAGFVAKRIDKLESGLGTRIDKVESGLGTRIDKVESGLGTRIDKVESGLGTRIDKVESGLGTRIDKVESGLGTRIDKVESGLGKVESGLGARIEQARLEARADNEKTRNEVRAELIDIRASLRALEQRSFELLMPRRPVATGTDDA